VQKIKLEFSMKIVQYFKDSYNELVYKVSWPTRTELTNSAVVVLIASMIIALAVFAVDFVFERIMRFVYENI
jgi:preprotein translocase subunit SecE